MQMNTKKGWRSVTLVVLLFVAYASTLRIEAQGQYQVQGGRAPGSPRVLSKNTNDIQKMTENQDAGDSDWQAQDLKIAKEENQKTTQEEVFKRNQDDVNSRRFEIQAEKRKEVEDKMFQNDLVTLKEQAKRRAGEERRKSAQALSNEQQEDIKRFNQNLRHVKRREELMKKKLELERQKLEFVAEQNVKKQREQKTKMESEQGVKEENEKAKTKAQVEMDRQETYLKKQQEARSKQVEQKEKATNSKAEQAQKRLQQKDEAQAKKIQAQLEQIQKQKDQIAEQKQKKAEQEQKVKQQQQEEREKRCTPVQVWSAGWPNNVWQFQVKNNIYRKEQYGFRRGYNVLVLQPNTYAVQSLRSFDTYASHHESRQMADFLRSIPNGSVIMVACQDECSHHREGHLRNAFAQVGFHQAQRIGFRHSYVGIVVKGHGGAKEQWPHNNHMVSVSDRFNC